MKLLSAVFLSFSMFSRIRTPKVEWNDVNRKNALLVLPLVGLLIGFFLFLWVRLSSLLGFGVIPFAAGLTLIPILLTGGIHFDGFLDVVDALSSQASPERARQILKDSHIGSFAAMGACIYFLAYFALASALPRDDSTALFLALLHTSSRAAAVFAATQFSTSCEPGLLASCRGSEKPLRPLAISLCWLLACAAGLCVCFRLRGVFTLLGLFAILLYLLRLSKKRFGGMNGDLAGFLLSLAELFMLAFFVLGGKLF